MSTTEVGKEIGMRWKKLHDDEKQKFVDYFRENQESYKVDKKNYEKSVDTGVNEGPSVITTPKTKKGKDPLAPKAPLSSYMEFTVQERPKILENLGKLSLVEVGKELGRRWKCLGQLDKEVFENKSRVNRSRYQSEMMAYTSKTASDDSSSGPDLGIVPPPPPEDEVSESPQAGSSTAEVIIKLDDLGFAKQPQYSYHPALKTGVFARGTRVKVTFLGTGESATVDKSNWIVYSKPSESRISTSQLKKTATFRCGLEQLHSLRSKVLSGVNTPLTSAGIGFLPQVEQRRLRALDKDHLQAEEEENLRLMKKKMNQEVGTKFWRCRDCPWRGKYSLRAKCHARECGQRKRTNTRKTKEKKFQCSNSSCDLSFALRSQLLHHYRYWIYSICMDCQCHHYSSYHYVPRYYTYL